jgi:hypothetical protein
MIGDALITVGLLAMVRNAQFSDRQKWNLENPQTQGSRNLPDLL